MEKTSSQREKEHIIIDGFRYRKDRLNADGSESWRCFKRDCRGRIKVISAQSQTVISDHNHAPDPDSNEAKKIAAEIRRRAATTVERPRQIIQQSTVGMSLQTASVLPSYTASQRMIERKRKRNDIPNANVTSLHDIDIPELLQNTTRDAPFLLWDSGADDADRILMFGTTENLNLLQQNEHWFMDGTFKVSPTIFTQVFTIHALINNSAYPLIYVLLPAKTEHGYERVMRKIVELHPGLTPSSIMVDFEKAILNSCETVFPGARLVGCFFHLGQCLWRKVQECHLAETYRDDENVRMHIKMLLALSFVPVADVPAAFDDLVEISPEEVTQINDYWEDNYVGRQRRNRRANPRFPIQLWNMRDRLDDSLPRTNNSVEAWHRAFQQTVDCHHPTVYKIVDHFRKEQDHVEIMVERYRGGYRQPEASKSKYVRLNRRLQAVAPTFGTIPLVDYLRGIAHNVAI